MKKAEYDELKKKALKKLKERRKTDFTIDYSMKSADELLEINEIYQAELESQNEDLRESLIKLEQSSSEFELLFNQSPIPMLVVNKKLQIQRANQKSFELFGSRIRNSKEKDRYLYSFLASGQVESFLNWFENQDTEKPLKIRLQTANRRVKNCQLQIRQWNFEEVSYLVTIEDIHEHLKLFDMYKQLADTIPDVILRLDIEGNIKYANQKAIEVFPKYNRKKQQHIFELDFFLEQSEEVVKDILKDLNSITQPVSYLLKNDIKSYYLHIIPESNEHEFKTYLLVMEDTTLRANKEQMFYKLFNHASDAIVLSNDKNKVVFCNKKALELFNLDKKNLNLIDTKDVFNHFHTQKSCDEHFKLLKEQGFDSFEATCITNNNMEKFLRISSVLVNIGEETFQQCYIHDITDRKLLENQTVLNANVFEHTVEGIMITNLNKEVISVNKAFTNITGYSYEDIIGKKPSILNSGKQDTKFYRKMWKQILKEGSWSGEIWNKKKDGTIYPEWIAISVIYNHKKDPIQYLAVFSDFSEVKKNEKALENLAHYDTLTKLPNRFLLNEQLKFAISSAKRTHSKIAVMFLDLDRFKYINDTYGHDTGDKVLIEISNRLKSLVRESDIVARLGGDEFIIAVYNFDTKEDLEHLSNKIISSVSKAIKIDDKDHTITASLGINIYPNDGSTIKTLLKNADIAMYAAKALGKNQCVFFKDHMAIKTSENTDMYQSLTQAITNNDFTIKYQAQYDLIAKNIVGFEALLKWEHPTKGFISTQELINFAEESGQIIDIEKLLLKQICEDFYETLSCDNKNKIKIKIAVNISIIHMNASFMNYLEKLIKKYPKLSSILKIEILENSAVRKIDLIQRVLNEIKDLGFEIVLDKFGTGYSSLSSLKDLKADEIKIDKQFLVDVPGNKDNEVIVSSIIALGKVMGKKVIAQGVQNDKTKDFLFEKGCSIMQGSWYLEPLNLSEAKKTLASR